jgi:hypothetical protein
MLTSFVHRSLIASGLVFGATLAFTGHASAQTTGTVNLSGSVSSTLALTTTATGDASALDLSSGEKIIQVADLGLSTNNSTGYTLEASSGNLTNEDSVTMAYQVTTIADGGTAPATGDFGIASGTPYTVSTSAAGTAAQDLYIKYTPAALQDPGTYTGSVSLTVTDNN